MTKAQYADIEPLKDGSAIREFMHPNIEGSNRQSLAGTIVFAGCSTLKHRHTVSEEIYHITCGEAAMALDYDFFGMHAGDTVLIPAGIGHTIKNAGSGDLNILCCCSPVYSHEDTKLPE